MCSKKQMDVLFDKGSSRTAYPIKLVFIETPVDLIFPAQVMFVVPKRIFKSSPDRNTLKRRMREVYRLNKQSMYGALESKKTKVLLAFIYTGKKKEEYSVIEASLHKLMNTLKTQ